MWPDKEAEIDYLNFKYMVDLVADIATDRELSPSTIGLYGDWGSGKSRFKVSSPDDILQVIDYVRQMNLLNII